MAKFEQFGGDIEMPSSRDDNGENDGWEDELDNQECDEAEGKARPSRTELFAYCEWEISDFVSG